MNNRKYFTRNEIIDYMKSHRGVKIKHDLFTDSEYLVMKKDGLIYDENDYLFEDWISKFHNGMRIRVGGSWENNWYVFNTELIVIENNNTNNDTFTAMKRLVRQLVDFVKRNKKVN